MSRIPQLSISQGVYSANAATLERVSNLSSQLASGRRVERVSDDPLNGKRAIQYRIQEAETARYQSNIEKTRAFLETTDATFSSLTEVMDDVKKIAVQGANGTQDANSRSALVQSVEAQLDRMIDLCNAKQDDRYVFSGTAVTTKPFELSEDGSYVAYHGDLDTFSVEISPSGSARVNENGLALFKEQRDVFQVVLELRDALKENDPEQINTLLTDIDNVHRYVKETQGSLGGRLERVDLTNKQLQIIATTTRGLRSKAEDADLPQTIMDLQNAQTALKAGLEAGARIMQTTLLDYLR